MLMSYVEKADYEQDAAAQAYGRLRHPLVL